MEEKPGVSGIPLPIEMIWSFWKKREISRAADWVGAMFLHWPELQKVGTGPDNQPLGWKRKGAGGRGERQGPREETTRGPVWASRFWMGTERWYWTHRPWGSRIRGAGGFPQEGQPASGAPPSSSLEPRNAALSADSRPPAWFLGAYGNQLY